jgi:hypothetical protein
MEFAKTVTELGKLYRLGLKIVHHSEIVMRPNIKSVQKLHEIQHDRIHVFKRNMKTTSVNWFNNEYTINKHWTGLD